MTANGNAKLKLLYIRQMLEEETDPDHGLTMAQIIERLQELGISAERKGIYRDLDLLRESGMVIQTHPTRPIEYALEKRGFDIHELMLLVDAVESSRFLTRKQADMLVRNIKLLASDHQRQLLDRRVHVTKRISSDNESVFQNIDVIHAAIRERRQISFMYYKHGADGKRYPTHDGKPHLVTPVLLTYADELYYLTAWDDAHERFIEFRVDRMGRITMSDEAAARTDEMTRYARGEATGEYFGRFDGEEVVATFSVRADKVDILLDRFGDAVSISQIDEHTAQATAKIRKSPQFFGWVAGMDGAIKIAAPKKLVDDYRSFLQGLLEDQG